MVTSHYRGNSFFLGFCGALQNFAGLHGDVGAMLLIAHLISQFQQLPGVRFSDALIWNLADSLITDNGLEISTNTDSQSDIQLCTIFLRFNIRII